MPIPQPATSPRPRNPVPPPVRLACPVPAAAGPGNEESSLACPSPNANLDRPRQHFPGRADAGSPGVDVPRAQVGRLPPLDRGAPIRAARDEHRSLERPFRPCPYAANFGNANGHHFDPETVSIARRRNGFFRQRPRQPFETRIRLARSPLEVMNTSDVRVELGVARSTANIPVAVVTFELQRAGSSGRTNPGAPPLYAQHLRQAVRRPRGPRGKHVPVAR